MPDCSGRGVVAPDPVFVAHSVENPKEVATFAHEVVDRLNQGSRLDGDGDVEGLLENRALGTVVILELVVAGLDPVDPATGLGPFWVGGSVPRDVDP